MKKRTIPSNRKRISQPVGFIGFILPVLVVALMSQLMFTEQAYAEKSSEYCGMFGTFGNNPSNKGISSGNSYGFGLRNEHLGIKFSFIDNFELDAKTIGFLPPEIAEMYAPTQWKQLGKKRITEYGFDFDYYYNVNRFLSFYVGPGIYYASYRDVKISLGGGLIPAGYISGGNEEVKYIPSAEAGVHFNFNVTGNAAAGRILLGVGYHTERGITADVGLRF